MQVTTASTGLFCSPEGSLETELLFGETFEIERHEGEWVYGTASIDGYRGYLRAAHLTSNVRIPTHRVSAAHTVAYRDPNFKSGRMAELHMNALVAAAPDPGSRIETPEGSMVRDARIGWIFEDQLRPIAQFAPDYVAEALKFVGTPYEWGARSGSVDCSALIQAAFLAAGMIVPRDCIPQSTLVGLPVTGANPASLGRRRGDLVFWTEGKGRHVALMIDGGRCVHATIAPPHRTTLVQSLQEVIEEQLRDGNGLPTLVRRVL